MINQKTKGIYLINQYSLRVLDRKHNLFVSYAKKEISNLEFERDIKNITEFEKEIYTRFARYCDQNIDIDMSMLISVFELINEKLVKYDFGRYTNI
jgi:hypothetical protein